MPLGKTPILQNDLMAEGDNQKYLLFNDALVALEDAANRMLSINMAANNRALLDAEVLRYGMFKCEGHTVPRTLTLPILVGTGTDPLERQIAIRNDGTATITVTCNNSGADLVIGAAETALIYSDGTDVISLGGVANSASIPLSEQGVEIITRLLSLNFAGTGFAITYTGGAATITMAVPVNAVDMLDIPPRTGQANRLLAVSTDESEFDYVNLPTPETNGTIKSKYEANANTNAFTDAEKAKLTALDPAAAPDMTAAEIKAAYESNANTNAYTDTEKSKLAGLESSKFRGNYLSLSALQAAHPAPDVGAYAYVDPGIGNDASPYIWDDDDSAWVAGGGGGTSETPATVKSKYESNADTNAYTDAEKAKLAAIEAGATADLTGAEIVTALNSQLGGTGWQGGAPAGMSVANYTASHTLVIGDANIYLRMDVAAANTLTVPANATVAFPIGTVITVRQAGAGQTTVVADGGVAVNTPETLALRKQHSTITLTKVAADAWDLIGDVELL